MGGASGIGRPAQRVALGISVWPSSECRTLLHQMCDLLNP
jgi:hypothetical protein